jgi:hypothetical protein
VNQCRIDLPAAVRVKDADDSAHAYANSRFHQRPIHAPPGIAITSR